MFYICSKHEDGAERAMDPMREMARIAGQPGFECDDEVSAKAILQDCQGDPAAAVLRLVRVNHYLMRENERLLRAASPGFLRGSGGHRS
jgi:hypothetical protein